MMTTTTSKTLVGEIVTLDRDFFPSAAKKLFLVCDCRLANGEYVYAVTSDFRPGAVAEYRDLPASDLTVYRG
jgi:hypothetical protein